MLFKKQKQEKKEETYTLPLSNLIELDLYTDWHDITFIDKDGEETSQACFGVFYRKIEEGFIEVTEEESEGRIVKVYFPMPDTNTKKL